MGDSQDCATPILPDSIADHRAMTQCGRYGVHIQAGAWRRIYDSCKDAASTETGGVLVGSYTEGHTFATVTDAWPAAEDSKSGKTWFLRGVRGLNQALRRLWDAGSGYYLGEWHYHPGGSPFPSVPDIEQMSAISTSAQYACPEPLLLIVGGLPDEFTVRVYVFPAAGPCLEFHTVNPATTSK